MIPPGFERFWNTWPPNTGRYSRKGAKAECLKRWTKNYHETQADTICKHVAWLRTTADWLKDQGAFIPAPLVYLNQQRWDGAEIPETVGQQAFPTKDTANEWLKEHAENMAREGDKEKARAAVERMRAVRNQLRGRA